MRDSPLCMQFKELPQVNACGDRFLWEHFMVPFVSLLAAPSLTATVFGK